MRVVLMAMCLIGKKWRKPTDIGTGHIVAGPMMIGIGIVLGGGGDCYPLISISALFSILGLPY